VVAAQSKNYDSSSWRMKRLVLPDWTNNNLIFMEEEKRMGDSII